jgi:hypothetical protein
MYSDICPLTLCSVRYPCWGFKVDNGKRHYYNLPQLVDCFRHGDFRDPMTRINVTENQLLEIETMFKKNYKKDVNLCSLYRANVEESVDNTSEALVTNMRVLVSNLVRNLRRVDDLVVSGSILEDDDIMDFNCSVCDFRVYSSILYYINARLQATVVMWSYTTVNNADYVSEQVREMQMTFLESIESDNRLMISSQ